MSSCPHYYHACCPVSQERTIISIVILLYHPFLDLDPMLHPQPTTTPKKHQCQQNHSMSIPIQNPKQLDRVFPSGNNKRTGDVIKHDESDQRDGKVIDGFIWSIRGGRDENGSKGLTCQSCWSCYEGTHDERDIIPCCDSMLWPWHVRESKSKREGKDWPIKRT